MKQKSIFAYLAAYLVLLIPTPGRFVYGMTLMLELVVLMFLGTLISIAIDKSKANKQNTRGKKKKNPYQYYHHRC